MRWSSIRSFKIKYCFLGMTSFKVFLLLHLNSLWVLKFSGLSIVLIKMYDGHCMFYHVWNMSSFHDIGEFVSVVPEVMFLVSDVKRRTLQTTDSWLPEYQLITQMMIVNLENSLPEPLKWKLQQYHMFVTIYVNERITNMVMQ